MRVKGNLRGIKGGHGFGFHQTPEMLERRKAEALARLEAEIAEIMKPAPLVGSDEWWEARGL